MDLSRIMTGRGREVDDGRAHASRTEDLQELNGRLVAAHRRALDEVARLREEAQRLREENVAVRELLRMERQERQQRTERYEAMLDAARDLAPDFDAAAVDRPIPAPEPATERAAAPAPTGGDVIDLRERMPEPDPLLLDVDAPDAGTEAREATVRWLRPGG